MTSIQQQSDKKSVEQWERELLDETNVLALEHDEDAKLLAEALIRTPAVHRIGVEIVSGFTEHGAQWLAKGLCRSHVQTIQLASYQIPIPLAEAIVRILYLEGNRPIIKSSRRLLNAAFVILQLQQNDERLTQFDLSIKTIPDDLTSFGYAMHQNTKLERLRISIPGPHQNWNGARSLAKGIRASQVFSLSFDVHPENPNFLSIICRDGITASGRLFDVSVKGPLDDPILEMILPSLTALDIDRNTFEAPSINVLSDGLRQTSILVSLRITNGELGDEGVTILSQGLHQNRSVRKLNLASNAIGDTGIIAFTQHWCDDSPLVSLDLSENCFGVVGLQRLLTAVRNHGLMHELRIAGCRNIGYLGLELIGNELPHLPLRILSISDCFNQEPHLTLELKDLVKTRQRVLAGVRANPRLQVLMASNNWGFDQCTLDEIGFRTELNRYGRRLLVDGTTLPSTAWCYILAKCWRHARYCNSLVFYFLVEQPLPVSAPRRAFAERQSR